MEYDWADFLAASVLVPFEAGRVPVVVAGVLEIETLEVLIVVFGRACSFGVLEDVEGAGVVAVVAVVVVAVVDYKTVVVEPFVGYGAALRASHVQHVNYTLVDWVRKDIHWKPEALGFLAEDEGGLDLS